MTDKVLKRANELKEKINKLEHYLNHFAIPKASCRRIKPSKEIGHEQKEQKNKEDFTSAGKK